MDTPGPGFPDSFCSSSWQERFTEILPEIERKLQTAFRRLGADARADAVANGVVHSLLAYARLARRGRTQAATASSLAWYAKLQTRRGRIAGCRLNSKDVLSRYAQLGNGIKVVYLHDHRESGDGSWLSDAVDSRQASIGDRVALKLDLAAWLRSLGRRTRDIAVDLAYGFSTGEVGHKYGVTPGRISQLRRELQSSWCAFQGESGWSVAI